MMPNTVNIERHKLNQAMYQKLKRYIMSKRRRELEEKAQDAHFKRLRKEREERRRQAEVDAENLEETRGELSATRKKIRELTARRNELFQRWKQLRSEESTLKEKRKNEASAILANIPSTQFGINPGAVGNPNRSMTATNPPLSNTTTHVQSSQPAHMQPGKTFTIGPNAIAPCLTLPPQQHGHSHLSNSTASQDITSTLRGLQNVAYTTSVSKSSQLPLTSPSTLGTGLLQVPCTSISTSHAAAMAAVVAALTAQPRTGNSTDSVFSTTAAAAAYLNAIASLTSNSATSVPLFASNPMGILTPNSVTFSDTVDALTASGLCSLSVPNNVPTSTYASATGAISRAQNASIGHRSSPLLTPLDGSIFKDGDFRSVQAAAAAVVAAFAQQSAALSKSFPVNQRHSISGTEREAIAMDPSATCLAQIGAALGVTSGPLHPQKSQPSPQLMCSLNVVNPMLANFGGVLPLDTSVGAVVSTSTTTAVTTVSGPSLPPAPISYRGSITTGQSAQQIQLQQHQKQQQQHHIMTKYQPPSEFATTRGTSQQADVISLLDTWKWNLKDTTQWT
ncbi:unnamed protein product [Dicrocoelium dendriticum]|nr:unnamed protein product [Dicrocoelium dendriticum]